jgi:hypothetical protein
MQSLAKLLGYAVMAVAVFYVVMFFFAESIPLPYHKVPDAIKIERMIAAETIECQVAADGNIGFGMLLMGVSKSDLTKLAVDSQTRDQLLVERNRECPS